MSAPTLVRMPDGTDMDGNTVVCEGCNGTMAEHACAGSTPAPATVVRTRSTGPRKKPDEHPACAHCGGRVHFNMGATAVNAECLVRQYALDNGLMTDPNGRLPVMTLDMMESIVDWAKSLTTPPTYGKMDSASGGAGTYSGLKPKVGRKKKLLPAPAGSKIEDIAKEETDDVEADTSSNDYDLETIMSGDEGVIEEPGSEEYPEAPIQQAESTEEAQERARKERADRRAARKAKLAAVH